MKKENDKIVCERVLSRQKLNGIQKQPDRKFPEKYKYVWPLLQR